MELEVQAIRAAAVDDARRLVQQITAAQQLVGDARLERLWPQSTVHSRVRTAVKTWWRRSFDRQLTRVAQAPVLDGLLAEQTITAVATHGQVDPELATRLVAGLGRDAVLAAQEASLAAARLAEVGMRGQIATRFPRDRRTEVPVAQAVAEQWYARVFRATVTPHLLGHVGIPISPAEIDLVTEALGTGQPRRLYDADGQPRFVGAAPAQPAQDTWEGMLVAQRGWWLDDHHLPRKRWERLQMFHELPLPVQAAFIEDHPPSLDPTFRAAAVGPGSSVERAAAMFGTSPLAPTDHERRVARNLLPKVPTIPGPQSPSTASAEALLREYAAATPRVSQRARLIDTHAIPGEVVAQAVEMRRDGRTYTEIANELGYRASSLGRRIKASGLLTEDELAGPRFRWTDERVFAARTLIALGRSASSVAQQFGGTKDGLYSALKRANPSQSETGEASPAEPASRGPTDSLDR